MYVYFCVSRKSKHTNINKSILYICVCVNTHIFRLFHPEVIVIYVCGQKKIKT